MAEVDIKSREEHIEYLSEMIKLSLWFSANWSREHPSENIKDVITKRTLLQNHTTFNKEYIDADLHLSEKSPEWMEMLDRLEGIYALYPTAEDFEREGFKLLQDHIVGRVEEDMALCHWLATCEAYQEQSIFIYDTNKKEDYLLTHIENKVYPKSFLDDRTLYNKHMLETVEAAEAAGFKGIQGKSWLNSFAIMKRMMPRAWAKNAGPALTDTWGDLCYWGQFITPRLTFQKKIGKKFRDTGVMPYPPRVCCADIAEFKAFMNQ